MVSLKTHAIFCFQILSNLGVPTVSVATRHRRAFLKSFVNKTELKIRRRLPRILRFGIVDKYRELVLKKKLVFRCLLLKSKHLPIDLLASS